MSKVYSYRQANAILKKYDFPLSLTITEQWQIYFWAIFKKEKFYTFITEVSKGYTLWSAYITARKILK